MTIDQFLNPKLRPEVHKPINVTELISKSNFCTDFLKEYFPNNHNSEPRRTREFELAVSLSVAKAYDYMFKKITSSINGEDEIEFDLIDSIFEKSVKRLVGWDVGAEKLVEIADILFRSKEVIRGYLSGGKIEREVIASFLFVNNFNLENKYAERNFRISDVRLPYQHEIDELFDLHQLTKWENFRAKRRFVSNPSFSQYRFLNGVGDVLIDDTLIEIKTTRYNWVKRSELNQVILYNFIEVLDQKDNYDSKRFYKVALYYPRIGYLHVFDKYFGYSRKEFVNVARKFEQLVFENYNWRMVDLICEQRGLFKKSQKPRIVSDTLKT